MNEEKIMQLDEELKKDCEIDVENLSGELKKQSDLLHKWTSLSAKLERKYEQVIRLLERETYEKHIYYTEDFDKQLKPNEVKIYIDGDKKIIELKNKRDDLKFLINRIKGGIGAIRSKGQALKQIISMRERDII